MRLRTSRQFWTLFLVIVASTQGCDPPSWPMNRTFDRRARVQKLLVDSFNATPAASRCAVLAMRNDLRVRHGYAPSRSCSYGLGVQRHPSAAPNSQTLHSPRTSQIPPVPARGYGLSTGHPGLRKAWSQCTGYGRSIVTWGDETGMRSPAGPIRVMIVDDHTIVREGLKDVLEAGRRLRCGRRGRRWRRGGGGGGGGSAGRRRHGHHDAGMNGIDACHEIRDSQPGVRVMMLTASTDEDAVLRSVAAGATGFLQKYCSREKFLDTLRDVSEGEFACPPRPCSAPLPMSAPGSPRPDATDLGSLTTREREILALYAQGMTYAEIAQAKGNRPLTVRNSIYAIQNKLKVKTSRSWWYGPYAAGCWTSDPRRSPAKVARLCISWPRRGSSTVVATRPTNCPGPGAMSAHYIRHALLLPPLARPDRPAPSPVPPAAEWRANPCGTSYAHHANRTKGRGTGLSEPWPVHC